MTRSIAKRVLLVACAVLCACVCGALLFSRPSAAPQTPSSPYDLAGMLECDPRDLPAALGEMGFSYEEGAPYGSWQTAGPVEGQPECRFNSLSFGGVTPDLMADGGAPESVSFSFQYAPAVSEGESAAIADDMLARAGLSDPFYTDREEDEEFGRVNLFRVGRLGGGRAAYWTLWVNIDEGFGYTTYMISAYTEDAARAATSSPLVEALAVEGSD